MGAWQQGSVRWASVLDAMYARLHISRSHGVYGQQSFTL